ncbi:Thiol-disulfide isomerase or thioredoxin [Cognatiyoonia koreensis]|uniref:Thiol-disulfide isomerase or thioredoxin n=1 Tax=Cognatiyoonia koreensis TaxID=364200 RepID=A0A1I0RDG8_9RHOB|nr:TlpA disulfide reductase family protein [Cognatiyoonia koreensis]SEW38843.1 Thiol-disulfide isomerase or thioredoxin [Cognatiyoonia koreensis]
MRKFTSALLYLSLATLANADPVDISALRDGDMRKLTVHSEPMPGSDVPFTGEDGTEMTLATYEGKHVVLNFWATWCAPCRKEMPQLADLQEQLGGDNFKVVTIATGRNARPAMEEFFDDIDVDNLPLHTDARQNLARSMGVLGLPVTVILDPNGMEIARLQGDAEWNSDSAFAIIRALTETDDQS